MCNGNRIGTFLVALFAVVDFYTMLCFFQVFAASSAGFQCTGFEINSILVAYARSKAYWRRIPSSQVTFVKKDFWKVRLGQKQSSCAFQK